MQWQGSIQRHQHCISCQRRTMWGFVQPSKLKNGINLLLTVFMFSAFHPVSHYVLLLQFAQGLRCLLGAVASIGKRGVASHSSSPPAMGTFQKMISMRRKNLKGPKLIFLCNLWMEINPLYLIWKLWMYPFICHMVCWFPSTGCIVTDQNVEEGW